MMRPGIFVAVGLARACAVALALLAGAAMAADAAAPVTVVPQQDEARLEPVPGERAGEPAIPTENLWDIMRKGGWWMYPIAVCSFLLVAFSLERAISLRRGRIIPRPFVKRFLQQLRDGELDRDQALELCEQNRSPVAQVLAGAVRKWGRPAVEIEQAVIDSGERATNGLRRYLRVINGISVVSPLLGLLGTVTGMIRAFNEIGSGSGLGRPERLASGISEALLTTAFGLMVAIPALILYLFFVSRVDRLIIDIDATGQEVVNTISAEEIQARANSRGRRTGKKETTTAE